MTTPDTTQTTAKAAADSLAAVLPVPGLTVAGPAGASAAAGAALFVTATATGQTSVDLSLALVDTAFIATAGGSPDAKATEVLRPAFQAAAAAALRAGTLSELSEADTSEVFADPDAEVFELVYDTTTFGWLAVRVRDTAEGAGDPELAGRLGRIHDVEMALSVEIGRTRMNVRDALAMEPGKVIELDRSAGAPVDVMLNGRKIALGEVVVVDQDYGVRITRILDVAEAPR